MILKRTTELLFGKYGDELQLLTIDAVVAGIYFTGVKLSDGSGGVAYTNVGSSECSTHLRSKGFGEFTPGNFCGRKVIDIFAVTDPDAFVKTVQLATLNALSARFISGPPYKIIEGADPISQVNLVPETKVCIIGAFLSYIKKVTDAGCNLSIIERNEAVVPAEYRSKYVLPQHQNAAVANAEILIITGATLSNNTLQHFLTLASPETKVILVGPTASILPDVLFSEGVTILGATRITNVDKMLVLVAEGASGFHLFNYCATKYCVINE